MTAADASRAVVILGSTVHRYSGTRRRAARPGRFRVAGRPRLASADKESLIVGGPLVTAAAAPGQIVPVDSEHSAVAQGLRAEAPTEVARLVLTASGGPVPRA